MVSTNGVTTSDDFDLGAVATVFQAIQGHWLSACLGVLMDLKIPEILAGQQSPVEFKQLAKLAGVSEAGLDHFYKVLRVCGQWSLLDEEREGRLFSANSATRQLVRGKDASLGHFVDHQINKPKWDAWKMLPEAVRTGAVPFALAHGGLDMHQYDEVKGNEAFAEDFQQAMTYFTKLSLRGGEVSLKDAFDWKTSKCIMDVGGGRGECLSHCMLHAGPGCRGVLMDRPWVLDSVDIKGTFEAKGIEDAAKRLKFVSAEVREPFPAAVKEAGVDTLVMKHFLSGFSDADADIILKHCKEVLPASGKILLLQTLVPEAGDRDHNVCKDGVAPGLFSIEILAMCPGGGWRTLSEWKTMFAKHGYALEDVKAVGANMSLMCWGLTKQ
ncbi:probable mitomycin biosynthesis 6-O-methyltransferase [Coccomyxa sp. Obi]|nr:probable mitomycin biosynthesis 6-O-methyltransferase [Coccomyxa sp. Obi]